MPTRYKKKKTSKLVKMPRESPNDLLRGERNLNLIGRKRNKSAVRKYWKAAAKPQPLNGKRKK